MTSGGRKDVKPPPPRREAPVPRDRLLTSEDLFGDMVDAPPEPQAEVPASPRPAPIRIQVSEPGSKDRPELRPPPKAGEVLPDDVAALLDAFSEPAEAAAREEAARKAAASAAPPAREPVKPAAPPRPPAPAKPAAASRPAITAKPAAPAKAAPPPPPPADDDEVAGLLDELAEPEAQELPMLPLTDTAPPPWRQAPAKAEDSLLDLPGIEKALSGATAGKDGRVGAKFQAAVPDKGPPVAERVALDLAALAEDAFAHPQSKPATSSPARRDQLYGPYQLLEKVAVGGMAEVFKAKRSGVEGFEKVVAVKRILNHLSDNKEFVDMFINEAKMVAGLTHPNIVQIFDLGKIERSYYIAMDYVHGRDLRSIMKRAKERGIRIPLDISALVVAKVCAALEYAHRKKDEDGRPMKIVHRDISPQNILISFEGEVKITDFGIAKAATKASTTERGALRGKLLYMSPEQAWGKSIDKRSDIFSLGIVFYEMITDEKPFLASSEMSILEMVRDCRLAPPTRLNPRVPEKLERVVMKALEKDAEQRYQDAGEIPRDLERALEGRKPPTVAELARFMEVLFDPNERGVTAHDEHTSGEHRPAAGLEVELDSTPPDSEAAAADAPPVAKDMSIDKLLKRFGIK